MVCHELTYSCRLCLMVESKTGQYSYNILNIFGLYFLQLCGVYLGRIHTMFGQSIRIISIRIIRLKSWKIVKTQPGRLFLWEPGNQVPTKCISSSELFVWIHALSRIDKFNRRMWTHKKWFLVTRNDFLWQELISCDEN